MQYNYNISWDKPLSDLISKYESWNNKRVLVLFDDIIKK